MAQLSLSPSVLYAMVPGPAGMEWPCCVCHLPSCMQWCQVQQVWNGPVVSVTFRLVSSGAISSRYGMALLCLSPSVLFPVVPSQAGMEWPCCVCHLPSCFQWCHLKQVWNGPVVSVTFRLVSSGAISSRYGMALLCLSPSVLFPVVPSQAGMEWPCCVCHLPSCFQWCHLKQVWNGPVVSVTFRLVSSGAISSRYGMALLWLSVVVPWMTPMTLLCTLPVLSNLDCVRVNVVHNRPQMTD